jgi:outer membrane protein assembly factor BamB
MTVAGHDPVGPWKPAWTYPTTATPEQQVFTPPSVASGQVFTATRDGTLVAIDAARGALTWSSPPGPGEAGAVLVPVALDGCTAMLGTSFNSPKDGSPAGAIRAVDLQSHARRWGVAVGDQVGSAPEVSRGVGFLGVGLPHSTALDRTFAVEGFDLSNPASLFRKDFRAGVIASVATDGSTLWAGSLDQSLYAFRIEAGDHRLTQLWSFTSKGIITAAPVAGDGAVYASSADHFVYALDPKDGHVRWQYDAGGPLDVTPVLSGDTLVVGSRDGHVIGLDIASGKQRWVVELHASLSVSNSGLAATSDRLVAVDASGAVHLLAMSDGSERAVFRTGATPRGGPALVSGMVYLTCADGKLYALPV